jgi:hypothetical protein
MSDRSTHLAYDAENVILSAEVAHTYGGNTTHTHISKYLTAEIV